MNEGFSSQEAEKNQLTNFSNNFLAVKTGYPHQML